MSSTEQPYREMTDREFVVFPKILADMWESTKHIYKDTVPGFLQLMYDTARSVEAVGDYRTEGPTDPNAEGEAREPKELHYTANLTDDDGTALYEILLRLNGQLSIYGDDCLDDPWRGILTDLQQAVGSELATRADLPAIREFENEN